MNRFDDLDRALVSFFDGEAMAGAPDGLLELVTAATATRRPRPAWIANLHARSAPASAASRPVARALLIGIALLLALAAAIAVGSRLLREPPRLDGIFEPVGTMPTPATKGLSLADGSVLVLGGASAAENGLGSGSNRPESIQVFQPATRSFRTIGSTTGSVDTATLLADGRVLLVEPDVPAQGAGSRAEILDPTSGTTVDLGPTFSRHLFGTAVRLTDGRVLVVGGDVGTISAELFDPATGRFSATGTTASDISASTATLLPNGQVLVVGQWQPTAELYDPATGRFATTGRMREPREGFSAALLADGRVLIVGGWIAPGTVENGLTSPSGRPVIAATAEIYDPTSGTFSESGPMIAGRVYPFVVTLADGRVLVGGGTASKSAATGSGGSVTPPVLQAELFDPATGTFQATGSLTTPRFGAGAARLADGTVLILGSVRPSGNTDLADPAAKTMEVFR